MVQKKAKKKATLQNTEQARLYTLFSFLEGKRFSWNVQRNEKNVTDFARFLHAHSQDNQAMSTSFWPSPQDNSSTQLVYVNFLLFCLALFTLNCGAPRKDIRIFFFKKGVPTDCSLGCIGDRACLWTDQVPCNWRKFSKRDLARTMRLLRNRSDQASWRHLPTCLSHGFWGKYCCYRAVISTEIRHVFERKEVSGSLNLQRVSCVLVLGLNNEWMFKLFLWTSHSRT